MLRRTVRGFGGKLVGSALLAGLLAMLPVPVSEVAHQAFLPVGAATSVLRAAWTSAS